VGQTLRRSFGLVAGDAVMIGLPHTLAAEWVVVDLACGLYGFVSVPVDSLAPARTLEYLVEQSRPKASFFSTTCPRTIREELPLLTERELQDMCPAAMSFVPDDVLWLTEEEDRVHLFTLQPTSGSTGMPKLLVRTRWNWARRSGGRDTTMLIGSVASPAPRSWMWLNLLSGGKTAVSSIDTLVDDCQMVHPTQVSAPPLVWETICDRIRAGRLRVSTDFEGDVDWMTALFGPACRAVTNTGAAISPQTWRIMRSCFGANDGYGTSETGAIAVNGQLVEGVKIKLVDVPELGYTTDDQPYPRGELVVCTSTMCDGYFDDWQRHRPPESNDDAGQRWFATGDIVKQIDATHIRLIDRKSSCVKLSNGKFVALTTIEHILQQSPIVKQVFVHLDPASSFLAAVIVPAEEELRKFLAHTSPDQSNEPPAAELRILRHLRDLQAQQHPSVAQDLIRWVHLSPELFSVENGLLTASLKLNRPALQKRFVPFLSQESRAAGPVTTPTDELRTRILVKIQEIVGYQVTEDDSCATLGLDSLSATQLALKLSDVQGSRVTISTIFLSRTVSGLLVSLATSGNQNQNDVRNREIDLEFRLLQQDISAPLPSITSFQMAPIRPQPRLLLTGATGFLGAHLLDRLRSTTADHPRLGLVCLVRGGARRLQERLQHFQLCTDLDGVEVIPFAGLDQSRLDDASRNPLGLPEEYRQQVAGCDVVLHCAAAVNWVLPYSALRTVNTLSLLALCRAVGPGKSFHFISTIAAAAPGSCETRAPEPNIHHGYGTSKWAAERLLSVLGHQYGMDVTVFRPGHLVPVSSPAGNQAVSMNEDDILVLLIRACIAAGCFPPCRNTLAEWSSVQTTAAAIVRTVEAKLHRKNLPSEFNLFSTQPTSYHTLFQSLIHAGFPLEPLTATEWARRIEDPRSPLLPLASMFAAGLSSSNFRKTHNTTQINYISPPCWPEITPDVMARWIDNLIERRVIPHPN
jgi:fatty acid CoA ligase FadD9